MAFILAFVICLALIFWSGSLRIRVESTGKIQNSHTYQTSRYGGLAITAVVTSLFISEFEGRVFDWKVNLVILVTGILVYVVGFIDDHKGHVSPGFRVLILTVLAAVAGSEIGWLSRLNIDLLDGVMRNHIWIAAGVTLFGVIGLTNAFNLIDGLNGLCSGTAIIVLMVLVYLARLLGQVELAEMYSLIMFCSLGFFVVNFPFGKLFLGDGGSYYLGFVIAQGCIFLNSIKGDVSSWVFVLLCFYPIWETIFSFGRRLILGADWSKADRGHLHTMIYDSLIVWKYESTRETKVLMNALASSLCLVLPAITGILSIKFYNRTVFLQVSCLLLIFIYCVTYRLLWSFLRSSRKVTRSH